MSVEQRGHISKIMINALHTFKTTRSSKLLLTWHIGKYGSQACRLHARR